MQHVLVVGAGLAGLASVRALRDQGHDGDVTVIGAEPEPPYDRPPLSKDFLTGGTTRSELALDSPAAVDALGATWLLGVPAVSLVPSDATLVLADGRRLRADGVVVATGSHPRRLPGLEGISNVHELRSLADAERLRAGLAAAQEVVVVGGGFVGAEVAASARALGLGVTIVESEPVLLRRQFGTELSEVWRSLHRRHGVTVHTDAVVDGWLRTDAGDRVCGVRLADGTTAAADLVVVAIGSEAATDWLAGSAVDRSGGLLCDAVGRTRWPAVVGAGDVVRAPHPYVGDTLRLEHWTHSLHQPAVAVAALLGGRPRPLDAAPYVWSDQYDARIQFVGHRRPGDVMRVEVGDPAEGPFTASFSRGERPVAVLSVSQPREFARRRRELPPGRPASRSG